MYGTKDMHHIQKEIVYSLSVQSPQRFSQLQPAQVANNIFSYHLKRLIETGNIEHTELGYIPTRKALKAVLLGSSSDRPKLTPALLTMLYITNPAGDVLLIQRTNKPFEGWNGLPSGLIHSGESIEDAAKRELFEKTGITAMTLPQYAGTLDFRYVNPESDDVFVHAIGFIYRYVCSARELTELQSGHYGTLRWSKLSKGTQKLLPEVDAVQALINNPVSAPSSRIFDEPQ
jgi:ADP-ribose pyrophosphatase YjhB (NUDIX family)